MATCLRYGIQPVRHQESLKQAYGLVIVPAELAGTPNFRHYCLQHHRAGRVHSVIVDEAYVYIKERDWRDKLNLVRWIQEVGVLLHFLSATLPAPMVAQLQIDFRSQQDPVFNESCHTTSHDNISYRVVKASGEMKLEDWARTVNYHMSDVPDISDPILRTRVLWLQLNELGRVKCGRILMEIRVY
jgi:hypothetical protein